MISAGVLRDAELRAQKSGPDFGYQLLGGVSLIAEALSEHAIKPVLRTGPVRLMPISA